MNKNRTLRKTLPFVIAMAIALTLLSGFALTAYAAAPDAAVSNEAELVGAVAAAPAGPASYTIVLKNDIELTDSLVIPSDKNIILISGEGGPFALIGAGGRDTIIVEGGLILGTTDLDGIIVTHKKGETGGGVFVDDGGVLIMNSGKISDNTINTPFGSSGVYVGFGGSFEMSGGVISKNTAIMSGGGVFVESGGSFEMSGGVIEYNFANMGGGGVFVGSDGSFEMSGGVIANNSVKINGGGVLSYSDFTMTGGVIENNKADLGGGVAAESAFTMAGGKISNNFANIIGGGVLVNSDFTMTGGTISNNVANYGDGGGVLAHSDFTMAGGTIENNTANDGSGGGVFSFGSFTMMGGKISNNTADVYGGGVYIYEASFAMTGGTISDNTAFLDGGGVWITNTNENLSNFTIPADATGVVFSNNHASAAYDRDPADDGAYEMYITGEVTWSEPFTQGYNNYDISYAVGTALTFYTVSFDLNAGEDAVEGLISDSKPILFDKIYGKLPELSRDGCTFEGWFTAVSGGEKVDSSTVVTNEADHVLYAQWTKPAGGGNGGNKSSGSGFGQAGITENNENALNNSGSNKTTPPANKPSGSDSGRTQNIGTNSLPGALFWAMVLLTAPALAFGLILYRNRNQM